MSDSERSTEIVEHAPEGYPRCGGCGYVFEYDDEITNHECESETGNWREETDSGGLWG